MKKSYDILKEHPVNLARVAAGKRPANSLWAWGGGHPAQYPSFQEKYGMRGVMISAVDLLRGIALGMKMDVMYVEGATGNKDTNFAGKGQAAIEALKSHDFVYVHLEATDECGHAGDLDGKIYSIEQIDEKILGPLMQALDEAGEPYTIIITPDHPTPIRVMTHTRDGVPCLVYRSDAPVVNEDSVEFSEKWADAHGRHLRACDMLPEVLKK